MIPGVFALSAWDLISALPVAVEQLPSNLTANEDWCWINRVGVDLPGENPGADKSPFGLPMAKALYGPVPDQLRNPESSVSRMKQLLTARKRYRIHEGAIKSVPDAGKPGVVVLGMTLPDGDGIAVTALNYNRRSTTVTVELGKSAVPDISLASMSGLAVRDSVSGKDAGIISSAGRLNIDLEDISGRSLVVGNRRR